MEDSSASPPAALWTGVGAVVATLAIGVILRLVDPLSSPVIPAEDPFTHMALVREHLRTGTLDALNPPGGLYPPGMHALLASAWAFTGTSLYAIFRWAPVALGGLGVIGVAALLWRGAGPIAGFVGALAYAVAPEVIFRTTMMSPTALDLALIPFLLYAVVEVLRGNHRWIAVATPMVLFLVFAHPWLMGILSAAGLAAALLAVILPWPVSRAPRPSAKGIAAVPAILGAGLGLAATGCGGTCGPGFQGLLPAVFGHAWIGPLVAVAALAPLAGVLWRPEAADRWIDRLLPERGGDRFGTGGKLAASALLAATLALVTLPALQQGMPRLVDLPRMFGWPILGLAALCFVALPFLASPTAHVGVGVILFTYPMVVYNPLSSPFWPHRTAVFLGVGLTIAVGLGARHLADWARRALDSLDVPSLASNRRGATRALVLAPALLVTASLGGAVYAGTPDGYEGGWYRLYEPCEFDAFQAVNDRVEGVEDAVLVTGSWQARLVLSALDANPGRVWAKPAFFLSQDERDETVGGLASQDRPLFVLVERHLPAEHPHADTRFLDGDRWQLAGTWCDQALAASRGVQLYSLAEAGP